jgi:HEAT repeat protein
LIEEGYQVAARKQMDIQELIEKLDHNDLGVQLTARTQLLSIGVDAIPRLIATVSMTDGRQAWAAAKLLGQIGDKVAVHCLIDALDSPNPILRETAAASLGEIRDRRAVQPLCRALNDPHVQVQLHAAIALSRIGDRIALPQLIVALGKSRHELSICMFIEALAVLGDGSVSKYITAHAHHESDQVRKRVVDALRILQAKSNV